MTRNQDVAQLLYQISQLLEIKNVPFKPRAYQRAATNVEALGEDLEVLAEAGRLDEIPGVGEAIAEKITEFLHTGKIEYLERLRKEFPPGLLELMRLPGLGPKKALRLHEALKIGSLAQLKTAAERGQIRKLKGFGEKTEQEILAAITRVAEAPTRVPQPTALEVARDLLGLLRSHHSRNRFEYAGSLRRGRDFVGDVDLLAEATPSEASAIVKTFVGYRDAAKVLEKGDTRARVRLRSGLGVDLRIVPSESFGAAYQYFTGNKEHNIRLRTLAQKKGLSLNEYALTRKSNGRRVAGATEEEVYAALGLHWIPPELREDRGEIEEAVQRTSWDLVELKDLRGDLHTHTNASDGTAPLADMVEAAGRLGYEWYGVSDHSKGLRIAHGLDAERLRNQRTEIDRLQKRLPRIRLLQGSEVDILKDGRLDHERRVLTRLDYVIGSVHSHFKLDAKAQTARVLNAMDQGIDVLGHPSARQLGQRPEIALDWDRVLDHARTRGVLMEINASPFRLDLAGERVWTARERGVQFAVGSDAHTTSGLSAQSYGITQARRGGCAPRDVVNALPASTLGKHLGHAQRA